MSLGETILGLRTERGMSQEALAAALGVSRQSVSKWETDASVPELDKLVKLSALFGVSLDELVLGEKPEAEAAPGAASASEPAPEAPPPGKERQAVSGVRRAAGWALIGLAAALWLTLTVVTRSLLGLLLALPFLTWGVICLTVRRNPGLWCGWTGFCCLDFFMRYATGITWRMVLLTWAYQPEWNYARLAFAWGELLFMAALAAVTALRLRARPLAGTGRNRTLWWIALAALAALCLAPRLLAFLSPHQWAASRILNMLIDWAQVGLMTGLVTALARGIFRKTPS